ncbi:unnamed protein product (macronuclear) [Paramecium tetraurelia]|uniref:Transmembrane protein n=1 Tax=Paramecium tetraurelia TaxID=5888 RepID=A0BSC2_PARTE|nr:uncharacterized protein GSPATT00031670001 [Paramecium tetraurelia]CAK61439.1 unnamed protein product [Paramecium tetraurelia]|eukprot:XP_001428837.1 hypothetical protein (macronuclear) [Paramecium tetraurelia strain d4-2]
MFKILALLLVVKLYATDLNTQNAEAEAQQQSQQSGQEIETEGQKVIAKLTACWVLSVQELSEEQKQVNEIIKSQSNQNRESIFYKIQTTMLEDCYSRAPEEELNNVMKSIQEDKKNYKSFKQQLPDFSFDVFNSSSFDWTFTKNDETLIKYIRRFEEWVASKNTVTNTVQQPNQQKRVFDELKKKISELSKKSQAKELETDNKDQMDRYQFYLSKQQGMRDPINYLFAGIAIFCFCLVFYIVYSKVNQSNQDPRLDKKNKKQKQKKE